MSNDANEQKPCKLCASSMNETDFIIVMVLWKIWHFGR